MPAVRWFASLVYSIVLLICVSIGENGVEVNGQQYPYSNPLVPSGLPDTIRVGGLFDEADALEETAFKHAVDRISYDDSVLPRRRLSPQIERLSPGDSYHAAEKVCEMMGTGIAAVFGPQSAEAASHVQSICDAFDLPHIETKWDYNIRKENYFINLAPHPSSLSKAFNDLVEAYQWTEYVVLYENSDSLYILQDLIKASQPPRRKALIRQLPPDAEYRPLLRDILRGTTYKNFIVDCPAEKLSEFFNQAQQVGLMNYQFSYIATTFDLHTINLEPYSYGDINITAFRLVDPEKPEVKAVVRQWNNLVNNQPPVNQGRNQGGYYSQSQNPYTYGRDQARGPGRRVMANPPEESIQMMKTDTALIYDAVHLFSKALHVLDSSQRIDIRPLACESTDSWQHGYSIINYMKMVQLQGLTGLIQFDTYGYRSEVTLDVVQLTGKGLVKVGIWDSKFAANFNWSRPADIPVQETDAMALSNRTLVITMLKNDPFCMYKLSKVPLKGNDQFEGYSVDLAQKLSEILGFKYRIELVPDGKYGSPIKGRPGEWDGMIHEILNGSADIAIADLTVNKVRETAVDFSMPFMNLGISILHTKPKAKPPSLFSFLSPFSLDVWIYMCFAFFGVSLILFVIARVTPYEWDCPHPCIQDPDELENQFTLLNSFWFTVGSLMQQGSDVAPKVTPYEWMAASECCTCKKLDEVTYINELTLLNCMWIVLAGLFRQRPTIFAKATSTRLIAGIWWFFTLIMVSSYTANLASFLIVQDLEETIKSLEDLPKQTKVKYGCVGGGSTAGFFEKSEFTVQKQIWENMVKHNTFVKNNPEGIARVKKGEGKYAFFVESTVLEYFVERNCELTQVGGLLDSKGYGVALPKNSRYRPMFNGAILKLQEDGVLDQLKRKWWKEERKGQQCLPASSDIKPLALDNVGGVFVVLVGGCVFAVFVTAAEFYFKTRENAKANGDDVNEALSKELKFALAFSGDSKPVERKKDSLTSEPGENALGSNQFLDLGLDSYGFPKPVNRNGGIPPDGFT